MIASTLLKCVQNMIFNTSSAKPPPLFSASFFFLKYSLKIGVRINYTDTHYTQVNTVLYNCILKTRARVEIL